MAGLQGDVKVPGIKQPVPKWAVLAGLTVTGIAIYVHFRNAKNTGAGAPSGVPGVVPGAGGGSDPFPWDGTYSNPSDPNSMDTATGTTFGDEGTAGLGLGAGGGIAGGGAAGDGSAPGPPFSSNAGWSAYALQQLTQVAGMDAGTVARALGLYLNGQVLDANEQSVVYAAIGTAGAVPVSGPGGYPPKLRTAPAGHKGGTTFAANPVKGLKARPGPSSVTISWDKASHATGYQVQLRNVSKGRNAGGPVTVPGTSHTFGGLERGDRFEASVLAKPAEKGAKPAVIEAAPAAPLPGPVKPKGK